MKKLLLFCAVLSLLLPAVAQSVPEIPFESVPDPIHYPSAMNLGELVSVAVNAQNHLFVISHSNISGPAYNPIASQLLEFDEKGNYVREIGKGVYGFAYGHMVRVDKDQNLWVVDKATDLIMRFNPMGHITMVLGRRSEVPDEHEWISTRLVSQGKVTPPPAVPGSFAQPTDIAWDNAGNMYVTDGYINSRVAKYSKDGEWLTSWGTRGTGPGQFNTPHNIVIDNQQNLYVADRANARIQVFNTKGEFLRQIKIDVPAPADAKLLFGVTPPTPPTTGNFAPGAPWALCITPGPTQYLYAIDSFPGRIYKIALDGKVVGMLGKSGRQLGEFAWGHGLACPAENTIWVADNANWRVQKLILHPEGAGAGR